MNPTSVHTHARAQTHKHTRTHGVRWCTHLARGDEWVRTNSECLGGVGGTRTRVRVLLLVNFEFFHRPSVNTGIKKQRSSSLPYSFRSLYPSDLSCLQEGPALLPPPPALKLLENLGLSARIPQKTKLLDTWLRRTPEAP
jgi:hypothetical protein